MSSINMPTRFGPNRVAANMEEMENFIFGSFLGFLEIFLRILKKFARCWKKILKELPSIGDQQRKRSFETTLTSKQPEVRSDLRFEIYGQNYL